MVAEVPAVVAAPTMAVVTRPRSGTYEDDERRALEEIGGFPGRVSCGAWFTLLLGSDGEVYSFGDNLEGTV